MEQQFYSSGQFAKKASVSVRTLRYYDKIGILTPTAVSGSGFRLYTGGDLEKIQYVLALKYLGFSLDEIKVFLKTESKTLGDTLAQQKLMMLEKRANLDKVIYAITETEALLQSENFNYDLVERVMKIMQTDLKPEWMNKYLTTEQRNFMRELAKSSYSKEALKKLADRGWTEEDQKNFNQKYEAFRTELKKLIFLGSDPAGEEAQKVAKLLYDLNNHYSKGDPEIIAGMKKSWENSNIKDDERKPSLYKFDEVEIDFIKKAMTVFYKNEVLRKQYADSSNFMARVELNRRFSTNPYGFTRWVFDRIRFPKGAKVLELGCGNAILWKVNLKRVQEDTQIVLSDFSEGMLNDARKVLGNDASRFEFKVIDAQLIDLPDASMDIVIANHILYHVPDRKKAFSEIRRVLNDNGAFYATTFGIGAMKELTDMVHQYDSEISYPYNSAARSFGLENGEEQLREFFRDVKIERYQDSLEVTEAKPLIDYALSCGGASNIREVINKDRIQDFEDYINKALEKGQGKIKITKDSGIFIAGK